MSHQPHRKDKTCLNCGAEVPQVYCTVCGQENVEPKQTLWHLVNHFFQDVTHFDGKFFSTMKYLLLKPGFLSSEYIKGRRIKYLDPIRMYLFISALFFLVFSFFNFHAENITMQDREAMKYIDSLRATEQSDGMSFYLTSMPGTEKQVSVFVIPQDLQHGISHYDSIQHSLPAAKKDDLLSRYLNKRYASAYILYLNDPYNFIPNVVNRFTHSLSKIFFISLPLFALILFLMYARRKTDKYYYVSHAIFSIHYYAVSFIFIFLSLLFIRMYYDYTFFSSGMSQVIQSLIWVGLIVYLCTAMKRFYGQGWFKTIIKALFLTTSTGFLVLFIAILLFLNSFSGIL